MSRIKNAARIVADEKVDINRRAIEHRATWMALLFDEARKSGVDIEAIARRAVGRCGSYHGKELFQKKMTSPEDLIAFEEVFCTELGMRTFEMEIVKRDAEALSLEFHYCPLVSAWNKQGFSDEDIALLCDIAMEGDRSIAGVFSSFEFTLGTTIAKGDSVCEICFSKRKK
jgi:hypothetical protein